MNPQHTNVKVDSLIPATFFFFASLDSWCFSQVLMIYFQILMLIWTKSAKNPFSSSVSLAWGQYIQREGKLKGCVSGQPKPGENSAMWNHGFFSSDFIFGHVKGQHGWWMCDVSQNEVFNTFPLGCWTKNRGVSPQIIHFNGVFHEINHPFLGTPIFGNISHFEGGIRVVPNLDQVGPWSNAGSFTGFSGTRTQRVV